MDDCPQFVFLCSVYPVVDEEQHGTPSPAINFGQLGSLISHQDDGQDLFDGSVVLSRDDDNRSIRQQDAQRGHLVVALFAARQSVVFRRSGAFRVQQKNVVVLLPALDFQQLHVDSASALADASPHLDAKHRVEKSRLAAALNAHD